MRRRTFQDRKFSQGDANSDAFRDNWERTFGSDEKVPDCSPIDLPSASVMSESTATGQTECGDGCDVGGAHQHCLTDCSGHHFTGH